MNRILIVSGGASDMSDLLLRSCEGARLMSPDEKVENINSFDSVCILGGNEKEPMILSASLRNSVEEMRAEGKPVFCEFVDSIGGAIGDGTTPTTHHRAVFCGESLAVDGISTGDIFDGHYNDCINYTFLNKSISPILVYHDYVCAHSHIDMNEEERRAGLWALWWLSEGTLVSSFRLCNFRRARLAPANSWKRLIGAIVSFLAGERVEADFLPDVCGYKMTKVNEVNDICGSVAAGLEWFGNAGMLKNGGADGVFEGFSHHVRAVDGKQLKRNVIRTDCTCEVAGAFLFDALLNGNDSSERIAKSLFNFAFSNLQVKKGEHRGMLRWSELAWETCYQDDAARAVIPLLLRYHFDGKTEYFDNIRMALDYMLETTASDGIRVPRTDISRLTHDKKERIKEAGSAPPCAHYNAYYHAALLLAYRICGDKRYLETAEKGLTTLMSAYPDTQRETSETEECCRLIFPLAVLYGVTGKSEHYGWLCRVADDLEKRRHPCGGYAEWDTGYRAKCSRNHNGECALLANNGDPVADLLYSNNWLPLGYAYAYMVTAEKRFYERWRSIASFMLSCQIHSEDKLLTGAWTRAFDMDRRESYGVPHDIGWAPCCIETGWTVGEILMGLQFMRVAIKVCPPEENE